MKKYKTQNFFRQVLILNVEGVKIVNVEKIEELDKEEITFEFENNNEEVYKILDECKKGTYKNKRLENFEEMKKHRKKLINKFYDSSRKV